MIQSNEVSHSSIFLKFAYGHTDGHAYIAYVCMSVHMSICKFLKNWTMGHLIWPSNGGQVNWKWTGSEPEVECEGPTSTGHLCPAIFFMKTISSKNSNFYLIFWSYKYELFIIKLTWTLPSWRSIGRTVRGCFIEGTIIWTIDLDNFFIDVYILVTIACVIKNNGYSSFIFRMNLTD